MKLNLRKEILIKILLDKKVEVSFTNLPEDLENTFESVCYNTLQQIKTIIEDDRLNDEECFMKIEKIVCLFENLGSSGGGRHDF